MVSGGKRLRARVIDGLNVLLERKGKVIIPRDRLYEWQLNRITEPVYNPIGLSEDAKKYLVPDNPKLLDLKRRYAKCDPDVITPLQWKKDYVRTEDIAYFRGDNAYVWQVRDSKFNFNILGYTLAAHYVESIDHYKLLDQLTEDNAFGNFTFDIAGRVISRDLLDSIIEINLLDRYFGLMSRSDLTMLDIGAGYGRLAYRASTAVPGLKQYLCADAVPCSTFISEFYLRYRKTTGNTEVVALDEIERRLARKKIDIAVNIHSFPECRLEAIEWWVSRLARSHVKHFMVNCESQKLQTDDQKDFSPILERHGYRLLAREPKYRDPVIQKYAIAPDHYFFFELH
jgi:hypothetical protein